MKVGIPKEIVPQERRCALVPADAARLIKAGLEVIVETGAGLEASFPDDAYQKVGAPCVPTSKEVFDSADIVLKVQKPSFNQTKGQDELDHLKPGSVLIGFLSPLTETDLIKRLAERKITGFSMDMIPRIARAQKMDALSSQSTVAGYKAVLMAADGSGQFFPLLMTAAGTIPPAKVLVLGAGVAGLQAIATAKRLGAVVQAYDIRPAVKEQVESVGGTFIGLPIEEEKTETAGGYAKEISERAKQREREHLKKYVGEADVVITTALIPGKPAPLLVTEEMVLGMKPGSIIVDLAAEAGGNCAFTRAGTDVVKGGVTIIGPPQSPQHHAA